MEAVVVAMGILMWVWGDACLRLAQRLPASLGATRSAWLVVLAGIGAGLLVALAQLVLPASVLSQGWSRETLQSAQSWSLALVLAMAVLVGWRGHRRLSPTLKPAAAASRAPQKRQPEARRVEPESGARKR